MQQGGIDLGEDPETTLWRELQEEIGLTKNDIAYIDMYPHWTVYQDENSVVDPFRSRIGQAHLWYFLKLHNECTIDLKKATEHEASECYFTSFVDAISKTDTLKQHVYRDLDRYFSNVILPLRNPISKA